MKKLVIIFILFLMPLFVFAEEQCSNDSVVIKSVGQVDKSLEVEDLTKSDVHGNDVELGLKMFEVGNYIEYQIVIKNNASDDYYIDEDSLKNDANYLDYSIRYEDGSNKIKAGDEKTIFLKVSYNTKIDDSKFENNKFVESDSLKIVATDKKNVLINPLTSSTGSSIIFIIFLIMLLTVLYFIVRIRKNKVLSFLLLCMFSIIPITVYAFCKCEMKLTINFEIENIPTVFNAITDTSNSCIIKYDGDVTDEVGKTVKATNVYFDSCTEKRNVIFAGSCWQIVRTTETSGVRMIYNGEPVDGQCTSDRGNHTGFVGGFPSTTRNVGYNYVYGSDFTYDLETKKFTLLNTETVKWGADTNSDLIGKYSCFSTSDNCSTLYFVGNKDYFSPDKKAFVVYYSIGSTHYSQIGAASFNVDYNSPSMVGYQYNETRRYLNRSFNASTINEYKYGSDVEYDEATNMYTLTGETKTISDTWANTYQQLNNTHYTCWNTSGQCQVMKAIVQTRNNSVYYFELSNGEKIDDLKNILFTADNVNKTNSAAKGLLETWYRENLLDYSDYLEDTVYCNNRSINTDNGWNFNGGDSTVPLTFTDSSEMEDLSCANITDQFSLSNTKATLKYPIGLIRDSEMNLLSQNNSSLRITGAKYWTISPYYFDYGCARNKFIDETGNWKFANIYGIEGIRPVITLKSKTAIASGTGSEQDPFIIEN